MNKTSEILENELRQLTNLMKAIALKNYSDTAYGAKRLEPISTAIASICRCLSDIKYFEGKNDSH